MADRESAIVLVSGGMDSCITAAIASAENDALAFLHVSYGQRTENRERRAFNDIADHYGVEKRLDVSIEHLAKIGGSSLTDENIAVTEADLESKKIPTSYVPFRNANMLSIAVSWAEVIRRKPHLHRRRRRRLKRLPRLPPRILRRFSTNNKHRNKTRHANQNFHPNNPSHKSRDR